MAEPMEVSSEHDKGEEDKGEDDPFAEDDDELDAIFAQDDAEEENDEEEEEEEDDGEEDDDGMGSFGMLSREVSEDHVDDRPGPREEDPQEAREFTRYLLPFLRIIDVLSSQAPYFVHYMCVLIDDKGGTERGLKRLLYFANNGDSAYVSKLMLGYRLVLVRDACRLDRMTYRALSMCFDDTTHTGHSAQQQQQQQQPAQDGIGGNINQRLSKLDSVLAFLDMADGSINYTYPDHIQEIAAECFTDLAERPENAQEGQEPHHSVLPYFIFYEFSEKDGSNVRCKRECAGYASHADFPALRLMRLLWRNRGCVPEARQMYETECSDVIDLRMDSMFQLLNV